jgi:hypothetical protein
MRNIATQMMMRYAVMLSRDQVPMEEGKKSLTMDKA